ncbi:MAG: divalent-cation tolerance protein CutA [Nitrospirae bacterium]|nr:divalent-cation tolerance protein CutA [Nitrospirota bacterium]
MRLLITTCTEDQAEEIAGHLLKERLVACVNIVGPVKSKYWWEGKIETENECMLFMKTRDELVPLAEKKIKEVHPYQVPEIISLEIKEGNPEYFDWVEKVTKQ